MSSEDLERMISEDLKKMIAFDPAPGPDKTAVMMVIGTPTGRTATEIGLMLQAQEKRLDGMRRELCRLTNEIVLALGDSLYRSLMLGKFIKARHLPSLGPKLPARRGASARKRKHYVMARMIGRPKKIRFRRYNPWPAPEPRDDMLDALRYGFEVMRPEEVVRITV